MTSPQLSPEQQAQADKIFKRGLWTGGFLAFGALMLLTIITAFISRGMFHSRGTGGWMGGMGGVVVHFMRAFATRRVRRAGLSLDHVESRILPRTAPHFRGDPIVLRSPNSVWLGTLGFIFSCAMLFVLWSLQKSSEPFSPFFAGAVLVVFVIMCLGSLYLVTNPAALSIDSQGIQGSKNGYWSHRVSWNQVSSLEVRQAFDYKGTPTLKTLVFLDSAKAPVIKVPLSSFVIKPDQVDTFVAQVEAKLSGELQEGVS